ncbi:hypothetical protein [Microbacterium sp. NPDC087665]|uniref:hypothetical protein n=1 Tax=Microbacterium sp. NPDC087665 TaxID=3364194 RepID=UPI00381F1A45
MAELDAQRELRELQRKAYGRDGGLTHSEAARLRELQQSTGDVAVVPESPAAAPEALTADPDDALITALGFDAPVAAEPVREPIADVAEPTDGPRTSAARPSIRAAVRTHWLAGALAGVVLLALGLGLGWALFTPQARGIPLTAAQHERQRVLTENSDFDPGSLIGVGKDDDALVWYGTKNEGELACIVIDVGDLSEAQCQTTDEMSPFGLNASVMLPPEAGSEESFDFATVNGTVMFSTQGEPVAIIQRWTSDDSMLGQFTGDERARAEELLNQGLLANLSIVGYFRDAPVWVANRWTNDREPDTCIIVDGAEGEQQCLPMSEAIDTGITVLVFDEGGTASASAITVAYTATQTPYLTIASVADVASFEVNSDDPDD